MAERPLTPKQQAFVREYLSNGRNASAAYRAAYDTKASPQRVAENASDLLRHPKIAPRVAEALAEEASAAQRVTTKLGITREILTEHVAKLATYDLRGAFAWDAAGAITLKPSDELPDDVAFAITAIERRADGSLKLTFADKRAAAVDLAKLKGWIVDKKDVRVIRSIEDLTEDELAVLAATGEQGRGGR